jgi:hypothetical protein
MTKQHAKKYLSVGCMLLSASLICASDSSSSSNASTSVSIQALFVQKLEAGGQMTQQDRELTRAVMEGYDAGRITGRDNEGRVKRTPSLDKLKQLMTNQESE